MAQHSTCQFPLGHIGTHHVPASLLWHRGHKIVWGGGGGVAK